MKYNSIQRHIWTLTKLLLFLAIYQNIFKSQSNTMTLGLKYRLLSDSHLSWEGLRTVSQEYK